MPGFFGALGPGAHAAIAWLHREFTAVWPDTHVIDGGPGVLLGAHARCGAGAVTDSLSGAMLAIDGDRVAMQAWAAMLRVTSTSGDVCLSGPVEKVTRALEGLVAATVTIDAARGRCIVQADDTGTLPVYYAVFEGTFLFSTLLRPLGRALGASLDPVAVHQWMQFGYHLGSRSLFEGIRRLLPGEELTFDRTARDVVRRDRSPLWTSGAPSADHVHAADEAWEALRTGLRTLETSASSGALMMSGGWDSRTLLAAFSPEYRRSGLVGYAHGDLACRELRLVRSLAELGDVPCRLEALDARMYAPALLATGFARTEQVLFPYWHLGGQLLAAEECEFAVAGVYGEVLGGHYGSSALKQGVGKLTDLWADILHLKRPESEAEADARVSEFVRRTFRPLRSWGLARGYADEASAIAEHYRTDVQAGLSRLNARGVPAGDVQLEAFTSEHRGTRFINAQILSMRAWLDVALPFCARESLLPATRLPMVRKLHNTLNREMLHRHAPAFLQVPTSASFANAGAPLPVQELGRAVRRGHERAVAYANRHLGTRFPSPRYGWFRFDFARESDVLQHVCDDLRSDLWDRDRLRARIAGVRAGTETASPQAIAEILARAYTVDLFTRVDR